MIDKEVGGALRASGTGWDLCCREGSAGVPVPAMKTSWQTSPVCAPKSNLSAGRVSPTCALGSLLS